MMVFYMLCLFVILVLMFGPAIHLTPSLLWPCGAYRGILWHHARWAQHTQLFSQPRRIEVRLTWDLMRVDWAQFNATFSWTLDLSLLVKDLSRFRDLGGVMASSWMQRRE